MLPDYTKWEDIQGSGLGTQKVENFELPTLNLFAIVRFKSSFAIVQ